MTNASTKTKAATAKAGLQVPRSATAAKHAKELAAKVQLNDKHALTEEAKSRKATSAARMAKHAKASNQTAVATKPKKVLAEKDFGGKTAKQLKEDTNRELEQEAKKTGAPRAYDCIMQAGAAPNTKDYIIVSTGPKDKGGRQTIVPKHHYVGKVAEAGKEGKSYRLFLEEYETMKKTTQGKLANGLDGRNAPHSSKAVGDKNNAAKGTNKADKRGAVAKAQIEKKAVRKAEKVAKAAPKADDNRKITVLDKAFTYGREGTSRNESWLACKVSKTVADYAAKGGALKYLPRWVAAGAIKLA